MNRWEKCLVIIALLYILMAIFTFGHAMNHIPETKEHEDMRAPDSFMCCVIWPFYWSWYLQQ